MECFTKLKDIIVFYRQAKLLLLQVSVKHRERTQRTAHKDSYSGTSFIQSSVIKGNRHSDLLT